MKKTEMIELNSIQFGKKIRKLREIKNMTQEYVAKKIEMSISGYGKIERGESNLSMHKMEKIAKVIGFDIDEIVQFEEDNLLFNVKVKNNSEIMENNTSSQEIKFLEQIILQLKEENAFLKKIILNWQNSPSNP